MTQTSSRSTAFGRLCLAVYGYAEANAHDASSVADALVRLLADDAVPSIEARMKRKSGRSACR